MNIKEQENKLILSISAQIIICILVWAGSVIYMFYLFNGSGNSKDISKMTVSGVPTISQDKLDVLKSSLKYPSPININSTVNKLEPFD